MTSDSETADAESTANEAAAEDSDVESGADSTTEQAVTSSDGEGSAEGVDTEHVMNLTFVLTLLFGVPAVVVLSLFVPLDGWNEIVLFVVRVGAAIWFLTAVTLYARERLRQ